jgi:hypothetical protein
MVLALQASAGNAAVTRLVGPPHADHHAPAPNRNNPEAQRSATEAVQRLPGPTAEPDVRLIVDDSAPAAAGQMRRLARRSHAASGRCRNIHHCRTARRKVGRSGSGDRGAGTGRALAGADDCRHRQGRHAVARRRVTSPRRHACLDRLVDIVRRETLWQPVDLASLLLSGLADLGRKAADPVLSAVAADEDADAELRRHARSLRIGLANTPISEVVVTPGSTEGKE